MRILRFVPSIMSHPCPEATEDGPPEATVVATPAGRLAVLIRNAPVCPLCGLKGYCLHAM